VCVGAGVNVLVWHKWNSWEEKCYKESERKENAILTVEQRVEDPGCICCLCHNFSRSESALTSGSCWPCLGRV
jgi:hypothetical protein